MWIGYAAGGVMAVVSYKQYRARVTDPDRDDPARYLPLLKGGLLVLCVVAALGIWGVSEDFLLGVVGALAATLVYFVGVIAISFGASMRRRSAGYTICEISYASAPQAVKKSMRKIYKSVEAIKSSRGFTGEMFGDLDIDRVAFAAAQRAVLSSELATAANRSFQANIYSAPNDSQSVEDRQTALLSEITNAERSLARAQSAATKLSFDLDAPVRAADAQKVRDARELRREESKNRVETVHSQIDSLAPLDCLAVEERISSVRAGYTEARVIGEQAGRTSIREVGTDIEVNGEPRPDVIVERAKSTSNRRILRWPNALRK
ncbi:hypothetical protein CH282_14825 [Rhodococcus sp. 06-418-1B]|nr:hypothetical protein [Rhodococcus sp. 06-418-1B]OZC84414.1 hypothetical protein CH282_14825 [Rhodococcus sp. 06-418-1B]